MGHLKVIWLSWVSKLWYQNKTTNPGAHVGPSHGENSSTWGVHDFDLHQHLGVKRSGISPTNRAPGTSTEPGNRHLIGVSIIRVLRHGFWQKRGRGWQWALSKKNRSVQKIKEWIQYNCLMKIWINMWIWLGNVVKLLCFPFFRPRFQARTPKCSEPCLLQVNLAAVKKTPPN